MAATVRPVNSAGAPPDPAGAKSLNEFRQKLKQLKDSSGRSLDNLHGAINRLRKERGIAEEAKRTRIHGLYDPKLDRKSLDIDLVTQFVEVILGSPIAAMPWRQTY